MTLYCLFILFLLILSCSSSSLYHTCILHSPTRSQSYLSILLDSLTKQNVHDFWVITPNHIERPLCTDTSQITCQVQQNSLDFAVALDTCAYNATQISERNSAPIRWILFLEDDMQACDTALSTVAHTASTTESNSAAIVYFSKFSRAFLIQTALVSFLTKRVREHVENLPYDIVLRAKHREWTHLPTLQFPRNLFHHLGHVSVITERNNPEFVAQYNSLRSDVCFEQLK